MNREEILKQLEHDEDMDVIVPRKMNECIEIGNNEVGGNSNSCNKSNLLVEHKKSTILQEVGLQVWRGKYLLRQM